MRQINLGGIKMGRSVSYLNHAKTVIYFTADWLSGYDEKGEYDEDIASINWEDFFYNLNAEIKRKLKSYVSVDKYDGKENSVFLENDLCKIGISEYCGSYSLSVAPIYSDYANLEGLAIRHAEQIENTLIKCLKECGAVVLNRIGTFSNGCNVYEVKN